MGCGVSPRNEAIIVFDLQGCCHYSIVKFCLDLKITKMNLPLKLLFIYTYNKTIQQIITTFPGNYFIFKLCLTQILTYLIETNTHPDTCSPNMLHIMASKELT